MFHLAASGLVRGNTGIGTVQRNLYPLLENEFGPIVLSPKRDLGRSPWQRILGLWNGFRKPADAHEVYLSVVPPLPFALSARTVSIIHDLRWTRTRGFVSRKYRMWDLKRTVSKSETLVCISQRTYDDLVAVFPSAAEKSVVGWLGPGLTPTNSFVSTSSGRTLLIGGAMHKRNEDAARLLAEAKPAWLSGITGIGVSSEVRKIIGDAYGPTFGTWLDHASDAEVIAAYRESEYFMLLSQDEGFGLPFIEALASGCQVIAFDQPLTRELFGSACIYMNDDDAMNVSLLQRRPAISESLRREALGRFSWESFAATVVRAVRSEASN